jgi:hypothetical protein
VDCSTAGFAALTGALVLTACRATLGIDDLPGVGSNAADTGPGDAAAAEAAVEAGDATDGGGAATEGGGYCAHVNPQPDFCADFDQGNLKDGWDDPTANPDPGLAGGGQYVFDTMNYKSPLRSARMLIPSLLDDNTSASASFFKTLPVTPTQLTVNADVVVTTEHYGLHGGVFLAIILYTNNAGAIVINRDAPGMELAVFNGTTRTALVPFQVPLPVGQWKELGIFVTNKPVEGGPDGLVDVALDGNFAAEAAVPAALLAITTPPTVTLGVPSAQGAMDPFAMNIDNVRMYFNQ